LTRWSGQKGNGEKKSNMMDLAYRHPNNKKTLAIPTEHKEKGKTSVTLRERAEKKQQKREKSSFDGGGKETNKFHKSRPGPGKKTESQKRTGKRGT